MSSPAPDFGLPNFTSRPEVEARVDALKPCPFCGRIGKQFTIPKHYDSRYENPLGEMVERVHCQWTGCPISRISMTPKEWNTRVDSRNAQMRTAGLSNETIAGVVITDWHDSEKWHDPSMMPIPPFSGAQEGELTRLITEALDEKDRAAAQVREALDTSLNLLAAEADQLENWAIEARAGGWSTHQVDPMNKQAAMLRNQESKLRSVLTLAAKGDE